MYSTIMKTDFYKLTHLSQYRPELTHFTSYLTPRSSRLKTTDKMVFFGLSNFCYKYLVKDFNETFFNVPAEQIKEEYYDALVNGLGYDREAVDKTLEKVLALHKLGYLPIEINALPEGTLVPMQIPAIEIRSTDERFAWVAQSIESLLSCLIWHPSVSATVGYQYGLIAKYYYDKTVENADSWKSGMCDFSMRGQESYESAVNSSLGWLTTFYNSSTVGARFEIKEIYNDVEPVIVRGLTSTEHSVMTSDYAIVGDERETYRRLLTEVYPKTSFAAVADSYDFWNISTNVLPTLRKEIEEHQGFLGLRHDSAEPVAALCGIETFKLNDWINVPAFDKHDHIEQEIQEYMADTLWEIINDNFPKDCEDERLCRAILKTNFGTFDYIYNIIPEMTSERGALTDSKYYYVDKYGVEFVRETTYEDKGMVESLYELFGGEINSKGYIELNPKIKAVYGDSITLQRAKEIYKRLEERGFAANCVSLGVGSFSMEAIEENDELKPFTRDTFSIAIKATYGKTTDGKELQIFKDPKGFSRKKSLKGLCIPYWENGELKVKSELDEEGAKNFEKISAFYPYFKNGVLYHTRFNDIRNRVEKEIEKELEDNKNERI